MAIIAVLLLLLLAAGCSEFIIAAPTARLLFEIAGASGPRRYLVLAEDPAELRPSGGYTGTVGLVAFDGFRVVERNFEDVYQIDLTPNVPYVPPPDELVNHLLGDHSWQLADAGWSPDFPTAAQNALRLYSLETGDTNIDGVVAVNTYAVDRLLGVTGPIDVPEYGVTVAQGDVMMTALRLTRGISTPTSQRKAFLNVLATSLLDRLQHPSPTEAAKLPFALSDLARDRSLLMWVKDPADEQGIVNLGLDGAVRQDASDYLYVVEANVEPTSKYNLVVNRTDQLNVVLDSAGNATSTLAMSWQNDALLPGEPYDSIRSYSTNTAGLYGAYIRVLTPSSSQLSAATGQSLNPMDSVEQDSQEANRHVFGNYLLIAPGTATLSYSWSTPSVAMPGATPRSWAYRLTIQKQPGLRPMPLAVSVQLPSTASVTSYSGGLTVSGASATLSTTLSQDLQVEISYSIP